MKTIDIIFRRYFDIKTFCQNFRFNDLRKLRFEYRLLNNEQPVEGSLSLIAHNCPKLKDLSITSVEPISKTFFTIFSEFKAIEKLNIMFQIQNDIENFDCFRHCPHLKQLDIRCHQLTEDFFANIATIMPKLQSLVVKTDNEFSDSFVDSFHSMKFIQKVMLFQRDVHKYKIHKKYWYFGKCLSEVMLSPFGKKVIRVNDNCGLRTYDKSLR